MTNLTAYSHLRALTREMETISAQVAQNLAITVRDMFPDGAHLVIKISDSTGECDAREILSADGTTIHEFTDWGHPLPQLPTDLQSMWADSTPASPAALGDLLDAIHDGGYHFPNLDHELRTSDEYDEWEYTPSLPLNPTEWPA